MRAWFPSWVQPQTLSLFGSLAAGADIPALRAKLEDPHLPVALALSTQEELRFARLFIVEPDVDLRGRTLAGRLVLSFVFDGDARAFLDRWIGEVRVVLLDLLQACEGCPGADASVVEVRDWLLRHAKRPDTFYIGARRVTLAELRSEARLRAAIETWLDDEQRAHRLRGRDPVEIHQAIRAFVRGRSDLPQGLRAATSRRVRVWSLLDRVRIAALLLALPAVASWLSFPGAEESVVAMIAGTLAFAVVEVGAYLLAMRALELSESVTSVPPASDAHIRRVVSKEDHLLQNQFTMLSLVRGSWLRRLNLRFVLFLSNTLSRHWWNAGELAGIGTIHFARIHQIDDGCRMLFMSDFDGSWERYLFDFLDVGAIAVVPNWTNLHGCPKARWSVQPTPGFAQKFLPFTRANQIGTELWYCALPDVSMTDILRNARIREGLFDTLDAAGVRAWLALF